MKRKGYLLAELLLYISIAMIIIAITFNILIISLKDFNKGKKDEISYDNMINLVNYLDNQINEPGSKKYTVENSKFTISLDTSDHEDRIFTLSSGELRYLKVGYVVNGVNKITVLKESKTLLGGIKILSFYQKNNLLYLDIKVGEEEIKKCLALKK